MRYPGGKHRQARTIIEHIARLTTNRTLIEPFCGACNVTAEAARQGFTVRASDAHPALIAMWRASVNGWRPEADTLTEEQYAAARQLPDTDPLKALAGFGASYGGKYFGGYARGGGRNFFNESVRGVFQKSNLMAGLVRFQHATYDEVVFPENSVIYCDPPYEATTNYTTHAFNHGQFWNWCRQISKRCPVFVTEFSVPNDSTLLYEFSRSCSLNNANNQSKTKTEKLVAFGLEQA